MPEPLERERGGGLRRAATALLDDAARRDTAAPGCYGAAWAALGRLRLEANRLGSCPGR